ncbi:Tyrosine-protein phosphatase non-receptor type 13 [Coemansia sp. RSA 552]|nr:Tyrosine-protein phosphatase non-receptor type 13 [Coemansia sp. RSA 552]
MMTSASFREVLDTLAHHDTQEKIAETFSQETKKDRDRMLAALDSGQEGLVGDAQRGRNFDLNRYSDVLPFNQNRVQLEGKHDYINATHITVPSEISSRKYIATQGPLAHSTSDFWRMVWEQGAVAVVMLANPTEGGRTKCARYWPSAPGGTLKLGGDLTVALSSERVLEGCESVTVRTLVLQSGGAARTVTQLHFTEWPDHGVPQSPVPMLRLIKELRSRVSPSPATPVIVHCSAGVGRTGAFIVVDAATAYLAEHDDYPGDLVVDTFKSLRRQRTMMVQTLPQLMLCYQTILFFLDEK